MPNRRNKTWQRHIIRYFSGQAQAMSDGLEQLGRTPLMSFMTCLVIGIALALPTALFVFLKNADVISHSIQHSAQLTLYIKKDATELQVTSLMQLLQKNRAIARVQAISPQQGLQELQQQAGFAGLLQDLSDNPLPWTVVVTPQTSATSHIDVLSKNLQELPNVEAVQLDQEWAERFLTLLQLARQIALGLTAFLALGVLLIVNNSIRAATHYHHDEIAVIKLLGGTQRFIRRPFLYVGMIYGLLGAIIAWQLVDFLFIWIKQPVHHAAQLYNSPFQLLGLGLTDTCILVVASEILCVLGTRLALMRHLD